MKNFFCVLLLFLMVRVFFCQSTHYKDVAEMFQKDYNLGNYEKIFNRFSPEMKKALPLEDTKQFLDGLKLQFGTIGSKEFTAYQKTYAVYKSQFEKGILSINISLDDRNKINGLYIKPYEEQKRTLQPNNKAINALYNFPQNISNTIVSNMKDLPNNTQVSIAIIENGKTAFYGIIKKNDTIKSIVNQNMVFEIGSITKVFTSTVLASLVEDKKINLNDDINSYYSFPFKNNIKISFLSLANHTSGLPRLPDNMNLSKENQNPYKDYGKKELESYLKNNLKLQYTTSRKYEYSNLGAGLLGYTLGKSQKTTFQQLLQKRIFDQYKMNNSYTSNENLKDKLVNGLNEKGEQVSNWDFDTLFGGGGILSTTKDLAKFVESQFNPKNTQLSLTRTCTFTINNTMKTGLGWHILKNKNKQDLFWHNGGTAGYSSSLVFDVENKNAVIILSNISSFSPQTENVEKLCFMLMDLTKKK